MNQHRPASLAPAASKNRVPIPSLDRLISWSDREDPGVRYFSGTATYSREVEAPEAWFVEGSQIWLDLGDVREVAEVVVNGRELRTVWKRPYRADIRPALRPGRNRIELRVTNLWPNRLIGDLQPGAEKHTFTVREVYGVDSPLLPSGILGPVRIDVLKARSLAGCGRTPLLAHCSP